MLDKIKEFYKEDTGLKVVATIAVVAFVCVLIAAGVSGDPTDFINE